MTDLTNTNTPATGPWPLLRALNWSLKLLVVLVCCHNSLPRVSGQALVPAAASWETTAVDLKQSADRYYSERYYRRASQAYRDYVNLLTIHVDGSELKQRERILDAYDDLVRAEFAARADTLSKSVEAYRDYAKETYQPHKFPQGHRRLFTAQQMLALFGRGTSSAGSRLQAAEVSIAGQWKLAKQTRAIVDLHRYIRMLHDQSGFAGVAKRYVDEVRFAKLALNAWVQSMGSNASGRSYHELRSRLEQNLGHAYKKQGDYERAARHTLQAIDSLETARGKDAPYLSDLLGNMGWIYFCLGEYDNSATTYRRAVTIQNRELQRALAAGSEAASLNALGNRRATLSGMLSIWPKTSHRVEELYEFVWNYRGMLARTMTRKRATLTSVDTEEQAEYQQICGELGRRLHWLAAQDKDPDRDARLHSLAIRRERIERSLAVPSPAHQTPPSVAELSEQLAADAVFVDIHLYLRCSQDFSQPGEKGERLERQLVAFLVRPKRDVVRVELGSEQRINEVVRQWRRAISARQPSVAAHTLHDLLWKPLAQHLPDQTRVVYVCPEGGLNSIPWGHFKTQMGTILFESLLSPKYHTDNSCCKHRKSGFIS